MNAKIIHKFIALAEKKLEGDWVLLGGTLLYFFNHDYRVTSDIDFVPLGKSKSNQNLLQVFEIAAELGLPVETINSAALYFLEKVPEFQKELVPIHEWKTGRILRPNLYLFFVLKLSRFSESDYLDCVEFLKIDLKEKTPETLIRIEKLIQRILKTVPKIEHQKIAKLKELNAIVGASI